MYLCKIKLNLIRKRLESQFTSLSAGGDLTCKLPLVLQIWKSTSAFDNFQKCRKKNLFATTKSRPKLRATQTDMLLSASSSKLISIALVFIFIVRLSIM